MAYKDSPRAIGAITGAMVAAIVLFGLIFANPAQCPFDYTQAQVDASGCSVGANIGLGLLFMLAATIAICGLILAVVAARSRRMPPPPRQPRSVEQPPTPVLL